MILWRVGAAQFQVRLQITGAKMHAWLDRALVIDADIVRTGQRGSPRQQSPHLGGSKVLFWVRPRPFLSRHKGPINIRSQRVSNLHQRVPGPRSWYKSRNRRPDQNMGVWSGEGPRERYFCLFFSPLSDSRGIVSDKTKLCYFSSKEGDKFAKRLLIPLFISGR